MQPEKSSCRRKSTTLKAATPVSYTHLVAGSLNVFNHQSNVDIDNRIVCYDIKELGKQLKKIGMLVVQDVRFVSC